MLKEVSCKRISGWNLRSACEEVSADVDFLASHSIQPGRSEENGSIT
jgi:hypothetical protein